MLLSIWHVVDCIFRSALNRKTRGLASSSVSACLSSFCLSHFFSLRGLSAPRSLSGRGGHQTPSATSDLRIVASFLGLILGFRHLPSTNVGLASCCSFRTRSGTLLAILTWDMHGHQCNRRGQRLVSPTHRQVDRTSISLAIARHFLSKKMSTGILKLNVLKHSQGGCFSSVNVPQTLLK